VAIESSPSSMPRARAGGRRATGTALGREGWEGKGGREGKMFLRICVTDALIV